MRTKVEEPVSKFDWEREWRKVYFYIPRTIKIEDWRHMAGRVPPEDRMEGYYRVYKSYAWKRLVGASLIIHWFIAEKRYYEYSFIDWDKRKEKK